MHFEPARLFIAASVSIAVSTSVCAQDPREELLKYDEETKKDKEFLGSAYEQSQPKGGGMFHRTLEEEEEDFKDAQRKLLDT